MNRRSMQRLAFAATWALAAAALWAPALASAAPADRTGAQPAPAETLKQVTFLKEVVVTGARYPRAYYESPQALSFVSRQQLRDLAPTVTADVLQGLPGVDNSKDSPWEQRPVLRGLTGQRVLVLMDGSPVNSARGNGPHPSLVDPAQVDRIEVVRGPSSVAYGSDALGGVINIITREALLNREGSLLEGSATVGGSTGDRQRNGYFELMPHLGRLSAFLSTGARRAEDFESPDGKVPHSGFSDYNALANLRYDLTGHLALKGSYQLYRGSDIGIPGLSSESPGVSQVYSFSTYERDAAHLTLQHDYPESWMSTARVKAYWQREYRNFYSSQALASSMFNTYGLPPRGGSASAVTLQDRLFDLDTYGFQAQFASIRTRHYRLSAGMDAGRDQTDGDNVRYRTYYDASGAPIPGAGGTPATAVRTTASVPDGKFDNYAGFAQSEWYLGERFTLSAGGRFTHYRYRTARGLASPAAGPSPAVYFEPKKLDDDALSGSLGLVYAAAKDVHVTANAASGYRQPSAQDLFFYGPASVGFVVGNPDLSPEKSVSYDLGLRWGPGTFAFSGNVFYSTYDDLIDAVYVGVTNGQNTYQYVNISTARIWGAEGEAEWRFRPQWTVRSTASTAIGEITSRDAIQTLYAVSSDVAPLPNVPPFKGSLSLRWKDATGRFWVEPSLRTSWRTNRLPLPTPGVPQPTDFKKEWMVGDVFAGVKVPTGQRLVLGVRNVANVSYRPALASVDDPGISVVAQLSTDF